MKRYISIFWYRRDLRIEDNRGLYEALKLKKILRPVFIFDQNILSDLKDSNDKRVSFIYEKVKELRGEYNRLGSDLWVYHGDPISIFEKMIKIHPIANVYTNEDYEPYGINRDHNIKLTCEKYGVQFKSFQDHTIFHPKDILKNDQSPYKVFTAYKKIWLSKFDNTYLQDYNPIKYFSYLQHCGIGPKEIPLTEMNFQKTSHHIPDIEINENLIKQYEKVRDFPAENGTSKLSAHLRFGTISIRSLVRQVQHLNETFLSELIWREFFMMILYHFPETVTKSFKPQYDAIKWKNDEIEFKKWCNGETGYPIVDAGMHELNETGFMHNRVRMIVASFLTKHLLIDWRWGEAYFAQKLNDFELSSNVGNWQWAAGCGADAAPYFRIFNPYTQKDKFDPAGQYVEKWKGNQGLDPIVDHKMARERCLATFKSAVGSLS